MLRGILWDNDGVLVDTERFYFDVNREVLKEHGVDLTEREFFDLFLRDNLGMACLLERRGMGGDGIERIRRERNERYTRRLLSEKNLAIPGMDAVLTRLGSRLSMGIVTSALPEHFQTMHRDLGLLRHFRFVLTPDCYTHSKPSPEPYLLGLSRLGLPANACIAVEDSPRGLLAATAAGLRCIIVTNPMTRHHRFAGAWRVVDSPQALLVAIEALLNPKTQL